MCWKYLCICAVILVACERTNGLSYYDMDWYCGETLDITFEGSILLTFSKTYISSFSCGLTIRTSSPHKMMVSFERMNIAESPDCADTYLQVNDAFHFVTGADGNKRLCGRNETYSVHTTSFNFLDIQFNTDKGTKDIDIAIAITSFHTGHCYADEHKCRNARCISTWYSTCSGYNTCGDNSDCLREPNKELKSSTKIVAITLVSVFGGIMLLVIICVIRRRSARREFVSDRRGAGATEQQTAARLRMAPETTATTTPDSQTPVSTVQLPPAYDKLQTPSYDEPPPSYDDVVGVGGVQPSLQ